MLRPPSKTFGDRSGEKLFLRHFHIFENARSALVRAHAIERAARIAIPIGIGIGSTMTTAVMMAMTLARIRASTTVFIHQLIQEEMFGMVYANS
jgi:hypothetical protein